MADDKVREACRVLARRAVADSLSDYGRAPEWGFYPEIGQSDWEVISEMIDTYLKDIAPTPEEYEAAYELLESRAEK